MNLERAKTDELAKRWRNAIEEKMAELLTEVSARHIRVTDEPEGEIANRTVIYVRDLPAFIIEIRPLPSNLQPAVWVHKLNWNDRKNRIPIKSLNG